MAARPRNVDLGPMYLQVGEEAQQQGQQAAGAAANVHDVARFADLMHRGRERRHDEVPPELPSPLAGGATHPFADEGDIGAEIAHLWVGTGLASEREVRVGLRESLLPDTSVRLLESEGRLRIEFTCGTHRAALWLERRLSALASELVDRLDRPVDLAVYKDGGLMAAIGARPGECP